MAKSNWISIIPASGSNNGSFDVICDANKDVERNDIITVMGGG